MKRTFLALFALALFAAPAAASEHVTSTTSQVAIDAKLIEEVPVRQLGVEWFFQDVNALQPGSIGVQNGAVIGLGLNYEQRLNKSSNWFFHAGGGYGLGSEKFEVGGVGGYTDKVTFKSAYGHAGFGYTYPLSSSVSIYTRGGLFYSSTKGTYDDGSTKEDSEPFKVFGIDKGFGGRLQVNPSTSLYGELYSQFGWASGKDGGDKVTGTVKYGCFRGGLSFSF